MSERAVERSATMRSVAPWLMTLALLLVWAYGALTLSALGGAAEGALIAASVMAMVGLLLSARASS